jgi:hypothetical protein
LSTGKNFNPQNALCMDACPDGFFIGVVKIFAFPSGPEAWPWIKLNIFQRSHFITRRVESFCFSASQRKAKKSQKLCDLCGSAVINLY